MLLLASTGLAVDRYRDYKSRDYFAVYVRGGASPLKLSEAIGASFEGQVGDIKDHYMLSFPKRGEQETQGALQQLQSKRSGSLRAGSWGKDDVSFAQSPQLDDILWSDKQQPQQRLFKRAPPQAPPKDGAQELPEAAALELQLGAIAQQLRIEDPIFREQWHLYNSLQPGNDLNVTGVWFEGIAGLGTVTAVIDDGLDFHSGDLQANYFAPGSYDFNDEDFDPLPRSEIDRHGTRCAGEIAAARNDFCGIGVAYEGKVSGIRLLSAPASNEDEALAMIYRYQDNQVYSCSWGPSDDGTSMDAPSTVVQNAIMTGVQLGRQRRGSVYVFATGNGAQNGDNCNFDGYANSIYSVTVGGIDRYGDHPYYSEPCSAQLVVTYSSGAGDAIHTTDVGLDKCYDSHGGTSAAAPLVAGVVALALGIRPDLNWRDIQYLCIEAAIPIHEDDQQWQRTSTGRQFSHTYGYGKIDAWRFVQAAKSWTLVKPQTWFHSPQLRMAAHIPAGDAGLSGSFGVTKSMLRGRTLEQVEHVTVTITIEHCRRGDLSVEVRSPSGVKSYIATQRPKDNHEGGFEDWTFMSVAHWGESGVGTWTVTARNSNANGTAATFVNWRLSLWGASSESSFQEVHPLIGAEAHETNPTAARPSITHGGAASLPAQCLLNSSNGATHVTAELCPQSPSVNTTEGVISANGAVSSTFLWLLLGLGVPVILCGLLVAGLWYRRKANPWTQQTESHQTGETRNSHRRGYQEADDESDDHDEGSVLLKAFARDRIGSVSTDEW